MLDIKSICRMQKIKTYAQLTNADHHNRRIGQHANKENIDKERLHKNIFGRNCNNRFIEILNKFDIDKNKLRKDAVKANEIILSLSPEFFKQNELNYKNTFNKELTQKWANTAKDFILKKYGKDTVATIDLHLDETTPHIHAIIIPVIINTNTKRKKSKYKLSGKDLFNRTNLIKLQKEYCNAMTEFGAKYTTKSTAKHKDLKTFYTEVEETKEKIKKEHIKIKQNLENNFKKKEIELEKEFSKYIELINEEVIEKEKELNNTVINLLEENKNICDKLYNLQNKFNEMLNIVFKAIPELFTTFSSVFKKEEVTKKESEDKRKKYISEYIDKKRKSDNNLKKIFETKQKNKKLQLKLTKH
jgi:hypothetical protein